MLTLHDDGTLKRQYCFETVALDEHLQIHKPSPGIVLDVADFAESHVEMDLSPILSQSNYSHCLCLKC